MDQSVYASLTDSKPIEGNCEFEFFNKTFIIIRAPKSNVFKEEYLYFSIYADQNSKIRAIFTVPYRNELMNGNSQKMFGKKSLESIFQKYDISGRAGEDNKSFLGKFGTIKLYD